jgi:hypothetical protein
MQPSGRDERKETSKIDPKVAGHAYLVNAKTHLWSKILSTTGICRATAAKLLE